jgi:acyl-CoA synthetase (AMP-forming)/AMP-acid ligase II
MWSDQAMNHADAADIAHVPLRGTFDTVADAFEAAAEQFARHEAYVEGPLRMSFAQWHSAARALASHFAGRGVRPGDVVLIHLPSSIDYAVCYAAAMLAGAVASGVNMRLGPREIAGIVAGCTPALIVTDDAAALPPDVPAGRILPRAALHDACAAPQGPAAGRRPQRRPEDPAIIIWTSGTTGTPKGAWFDHRNLEAAVHTAGVMTFAFDRKLPSTPFAHAGFMAKLWEQLAYAVTVVVATAPWTAEEMLRQMKEERISSGAGVPTQWTKLLRLPALDAVELPHLRLCLTATAPAAPELVQQITQRLRCPLISRYAMTESPSISGTAPGDAPDVLFRTVGKPQAGTRVEVCGDDGVVLPAGTVGRIRIHGPCVMRGYWNAPELTRQVLSADGWLTSSDLGYFNADGNLVLVGRSSDMYIRGGYNVYPLEVENVLAEHPQVAQAAVIGLGAPVIGEIGVAFVVPAVPAHPPDLESLRAWCRSRLADYKAPDRLELVAQLPVTAMLKIDKAALRRRIAPPA